MKLKAGRIACKVALIYIIVAGGWILFSDKVLGFFVADENELVWFSIFKGLGFVVVTGLLLQQMLRHWLKRWEKEAEQRERAEEALRRNELLQRTILDNIPDPVWMKDLDGRFVEMNSAWCQFVGLTRENAVGRKAADLFPAETAVKFSEQDFAVLKTGQPVRYEESVMDGRGGTRTFETFKAAVNDSGDKPMGTIGIARDITRRRRAVEALQESEERYRSLFDRSLECVFLANFDGEFIDANQAALDLLGYRREDIIGLTFASLLTEDQLALAFQTTEEIKTTGHQARPAEFRLRAKDGRRVFVETQSSLIYRDGRPYAIQGIARDMTARKQAEEKLRESERRYQQLFELESDAIILVDCETHFFVDVNLSAQMLYGYSREEFQKMKLEDISAEPEKTSQVIENDQGLDHVHIPLRWHLKKNGQRLAVEINVNQIHHRGRRTKLAAIRDITGRQRVMDVLRETTNQLTEAQRIAGLGSYVLNIKTGSWTCSEVLVEIFGIAGSTFEKDVAGWLQIVHPQDRAEMSRYFREEVLTGRTTFDRSYRIIRPCDQQERWVHGLGKPVRDEDGQIVQMVGTVQDITKRRQDEASLLRLATAVEQATETIVITDIHGVILYANPAFEASTGYTRTEALGKNPRLLKSGQQDARFYRELWDTIRGGNVWTGHFNNRRKDGTLYQEEATISPVRDGAGEIVNFVAVKRDVTREVRLEEQIRQAQKMDAIGTLAGGIAHDFNNILAAMFGYGYLLKQDIEGNQPALEKVDELLCAANRAKDLVNQILTFSRQREQKREIIPLNTVVKEATKFLRASIPANIQVELNLSPAAPAVLADPTQIYQVTINLATNAMHAMEGRPGRLTVELESFRPDETFMQAHPEFQAGHYARLTVADTGHGMDAKTQERIFEPFFTTKPIGKGTGLGLSVVHGIVKSHQGIITVESRPEQGTTFHLYFPGQSQGFQSGEQLDGKIMHGQGQMVLLVDDETTLTSVFQVLLKLLNYKASVHNSAREALTTFEASPEKFDLVVTDLTMPEINGLEMARRIRIHRPDLPVILLTGLSSTLTREDLLETGICELLEKPIQMAALAKALQRALKTSKEQ